MSLNRSTKAYQMRVKRLADRLHTPPSCDGGRSVMTPDEIHARYEPNTPTSLLLDAISYLAADLREAGDMFDRHATKYYEEADRFEALLKARQRPALSIVVGRAS